MTEKNAPRPIVDQSSSTSPTRNCDEIVESMEARSGASNDAALDDERQWLATVLEDLEKRSPRVREALKKVLSDGDRGVGPLLGLELATTENTEENQEPSEDSNLDAKGSPLLAPFFR